MTYLEPNPGHDEDNKDQEDLDDPDDSRQGAEEITASPNIPGQEPENDPVTLHIKVSSWQGSPRGGGAPWCCLGHADVVARLGHRLGRHPAEQS